MLAGITSGGRRRAISGSVDPHFANVSLLLHMDGADGSTAILDSSANGSVRYSGGNVALTTNSSKFGGSSLRFLGATNNGLTLSLDTTPERIRFNLTGDFTFEFWISTVAAPPVGSFPRIISSSNGTGDLNAFQIAFNDIGAVGWRSDVTQLVATSPINDGNWHHVAFTRLGTTLRAFTDGQLSGTAVVESVVSYYPIGTQSYIPIGFRADYASGLTADLDEVRLTKGVARYTDNFTPPTAPFPNQ